MPRNSVAYDDDFFAWTQEQARLLRNGELADIDMENLAEEIESTGRSNRRELRSRLAVLIMHLLKWRFQPVFRSNSWSGTIREQRKQVHDLVEESPSLGSLLSNELAVVYEAAVIKAVIDTGLGDGSFPVDCPFTPEQILSEDFLPE